ncbi:hypothetical protein [Pseudomonas amygdali]|uniref:Uncharacterized protein n=2 Tax=Pseudomonas amygdali pv. lachrymans TaxID=53707 RepID=A0ABR5KQX1_PSEAV|nr:hypothetical protein [Pseudomonas amygdali]AXH59668.1 hypothetical protein PLA107_031075 [Pseudomonas amygdali pv. lachrymans str. M301315]KPC17096.1 Uncharacterized protein AC499_0298 [Pseudomonas amygdali pv. lachrymans]KPC18055.1 Uncharacterized protein AC499_1257 [Pseudomonas amygdali pv. lachrymans]
MGITSQTNHNDLEDRIDCAFDLLYSGIEQNDLERVDDALIALPTLQKDAVDAKQYHLLEKVNRGLKLVFSDPKHSLMPKVVAGETSLDILEQVLEHTTPQPTHLIWNAKIQQMPGRMTQLLAVNLSKFRGLNVEGFDQILTQFYEPKHELGFKHLYEHVLKLMLTMDDKSFQRPFTTNSDSIFYLLERNLEKEMKLPLITDVILENQDVVLAHVARYDSLTRDQNAALLSFQVVMHLHKAGFERLASACGLRLLGTCADVRQFIRAERMGVAIDKDFVIKKLTGMIDTFMVNSALHYALLSKDFSVDDFVSIKSKAMGSHALAIQALETSLPVAFKDAAEEIFKKVSATKNALLIEKTDFMINWALGTKPSAALNSLVRALANLPHIPEALVKKHPTLLDARFGRDLGL